MTPAQVGDGGQIHPGRRLQARHAWGKRCPRLPNRLETDGGIGGQVLGQRQHPATLNALEGGAGLLNRDRGDCEQHSRDQDQLHGHQLGRQRESAEDSHTTSSGLRHFILLQQLAPGPRAPGTREHNDHNFSRDHKWTDRSRSASLNLIPFRQSEDTDVQDISGSESACWPQERSC